MNDLHKYLRNLLPAATALELELRSHLFHGRELAAVIQGRTMSPLALHHASDAHEIAGAFLYADASPLKLNVTLAYVRSLIRAAGRAEPFEHQGGW